MAEGKEARLSVKFNGPNFNLNFDIEASEIFVKELLEKSWGFLEQNLIPFLQKQLKSEWKGELQKTVFEKKVEIPKAKSGPEGETLPEKIKKFEAKPESQLAWPEEKRVVNLELRKFYDRKKPETRVQKLLVFAYYLKHFKNKPEFTTNDIKQCYQSIGEKLPPRFTQDVYDAISKYGYVERGNKKGLYCLSDKGEQAVDVMGMEN